MTFFRSANRNCRRPFLAPARLDELEGGVTEVVGEAAVGEGDALKVAHRRNVVGDRRVADGHQIEGIPVAGHVVREPLVDPQGQAAAEQRAGNDVELEDVRQLVRDQAVERVGRLVDRQDHAVAVRLGEGEDAFGELARLDVLLLELALRLEQDEGNLEREVVLQVRADLLIGTLGIARDAFEMRLELRVVVDLEVVGRVDVPLEIVVADLVLAEIRHVGSLGECVGNEPGDQNQKGQQGRPETGRRQPACAAVTHDSPR